MYRNSSAIKCSLYGCSELEQAMSDSIMDDSFESVLFNESVDPF